MLATLLLCWSPPQQEAETSVRFVDRPPTEARTGLYPTNRAPLRPEALVKLPLGAVRAEGWLQHQLSAMAAGMHGRLGEVSPWLQPEGNAWLDPKDEGERGWEELPYWLKGFTSLAYLVQDEALTGEAQRWIEALLASQREDGWFGPESNLRRNDLWPNMVALWALQSYHEASGDERVLQHMTRYFRWQAAQPADSLLPESWQKWRGGDNLHSVLWLYNRTGEAWLLDLARTLHARTGDWTAGIPTWHGVNICQGFREPAQFFQVSGDPAHLEASQQRYDEVMELYGHVPGGMFAADENCRPGYDDPRQAAEACSMVEMMLSHEMLLRISGDPAWAERCEDVAYNSLPAAFTPDLKALHYLTAPNLVQIDHEDHSPGVQNGGCMLAYSAGERYRCCQHNVAHGWPYFTESLWAATQDGGLAALFYAPGVVDAVVGEGTRVQLAVETDYPFDGEIRIKMRSRQSARFPLYLRVPSWINDQSFLGLAEGEGTTYFLTDARGRYAVLERTWKRGDSIRLLLPMTVLVGRWAKHDGAASVRRGPLWFSLRIPEHWVRNGGSDAWPEWDVLPAAPWNYGLVLNERNPAGSFHVYRSTEQRQRQPFRLEHPQVILTAKARRIPEWGLEHGLAAPLQPSPVRSDEPLEDVLLVPMGAARLRISVFPVIGDGPDAQRWTPPAPADGD
ncbi:MAG: transcriptional initiation protein Tat [Planctomycetota bacterium]|nr:MAG: transcriptional initiation protein Tat [Planctomycetota bacterium]